jgi:hypothetical protein
MAAAPILGVGVKRLEQGRLPFGARLAQRLGVLSAAFAEDYEGGTVSARATNELINFLEAMHLPEGKGFFGYPDLTVAPTGDLYAEWRYADDCTIAIEFLDSGDARYLVFGPNPKHPTRTDRMTGFTTADALSMKIAPLTHLTGLAA